MSVSVGTRDEDLCREDSVDSFLREAAATAEPGPVLDPRAALRSGQILCDRFFIEEARGHGGMGAVYRALDRHVHGPVALKVMERLGPTSRGRFLREARILAQLRHPGIVRYLEHGRTEEGVVYLVMEWLEGEDLEERLKRSRLEVSESLVLLRRVASALELAHSKGVVHRDIKPSNLFLPAGNPAQVKLLDFGIARAPDEHHAITRSGDFLGTIGYMAPEQALGDRVVDARADLFALGCVLYRCLTGRAPFESTHPVGVMAKVLREDPPPPSEARPELGTRFDAFIGHLLAKKVEERVASIPELLRELDGLEAHSELPPSGTRRTPLGIARAEQRIVSVILAEPALPAAGADSFPESSRLGPADDAALQVLSRNYSAEVARLRGGALLLLLSGRGEAYDRAVRAAQCALALRRLRPELALAIATGLAETSGQVPVGVAIDRAAQVLKARPPGRPEVCVDALTHGLIEARFDLRSEGERTVLLSERRDTDTTRSLMGRRTPFVGRDKELRLLQSTMEEVCAESVARAVLVTGPPGIGKTRLANEWLTRLTSLPSVLVLVAKAEPLTQRSAVSLVEPLIRGAVGVRDADPPSVQYEQLLKYVERIAPGPDAERTAEFLGEVLRISAERPSDFLRAARQDPDIMREQIRRSLQVWIDSETALHPVVLVLEDLHWGDPASVAFIVDSLHRLAERPFMILTLARPEVEQTFSDVCRVATAHIRLSGLTPGAAKTLVHATLQPPPADALLSRLLQTADGNAFYLEELIRSVALGATEWPDTVLAMAQARLEQLEPEERCVLRAASVFGETFWDDGVASLTDTGGALPGLLDSLATQEILQRVRPARYAGTTEYRFRHALLRDAAYAMLAEDDRAVGHRMAAEWLEGKGENDARLLSEHFASGQSFERAVRWVVRAARGAADRGDIQGAVDLTERGLAWGAKGVDRGLLLLARGYADAWSGRGDLQVLRDALDALPRSSGPWWLAVGLLILGASVAGQPEQARVYVQLAIETPPSREDPGPYGQALLALVGGLALLGKGELAASLIERASLDEPSKGDPFFEVFVGAARGALAAACADQGTWRLEYAFTQCQESAARMRRIGAVCGESSVLNYFALAALHAGRYEEAREASLQSVALAEKSGSGLNGDWARVFLTKAQVRLHDEEGALKTVQLLEASLDRSILQMLPVLRAEVHFRRAEYTAAAELGERAWSGTSPRLRYTASCVLARSYLALGRAEEALRVTDAALELRGASGLESELDLLAARAEALVHLGDARRAQLAIAGAREQVEALAERIGDPALRDSFLTRVGPCVRVLRLAQRYPGAHA